MAGKALKKRILTDVAAKGGADYLHERIASGTTVAALGKEYGASRAYISRTLNAVPEYKTALEAAREEAADALVEEGLELVDALNANSTANEISVTREQVTHRKFMAGSFNQNRYGTRPQNNVTISIGDMHLSALKKISKEMAALQSEDRERQAIDAEYEDVSDE